MENGAVARQLTVPMMPTSLFNSLWNGRFSLCLLASQVSPRFWCFVILWNWTPSKDNLFIHWIKWVTNTAVWFCILKGYWSNNLGDKIDALKFSISTLLLNAFWSTVSLKTSFNHTPKHSTLKNCQHTCQICTWLVLKMRCKPDFNWVSPDSRTEISFRCS